MNRFRPIFRLLALLVTLALALACPAASHETTRSYLTLQRTGVALQANFRIAFRDAEVAVWMDEDLDGAITWGEVTKRLAPLQAYVLAGFSADAGGRCALAPTTAGASHEGGVDYLDLGFSGPCPDARAALTISSTLLREIDRDHRMFLSATDGAGVTTSVISRDTPTIRLSPHSSGPLSTLGAYFVSGLHHLFGGPDHLMFLLALILPASCSRQSPRQAVLAVLAAVTGFTVAHALTLTAAMTGLLRPPAPLIEALIALSILLTALDNIRPFIPAPRAALAAFFGIFHGFGFASALSVLHLSGASFVTALIGFNLGIEAAQVVVVLLVMPLLFLARAGRITLLTGSTLAAAAAVFWLYQRLGPLLAA